MLKEFSENFNKEISSIKKAIETMKNSKSEIKNTVTEMNTTLYRITSRLDERGLNHQFRKRKLQYSPNLNNKKKKE